MMENPIKMDDFGVPLFSETPISELPAPRIYHQRNRSLVDLESCDSPMRMEKVPAKYTDPNGGLP